MSQPLDPKDAPDPATNYERAKPEEQSPAGKLDTPKPRPPQQADRLQKQNKEPESESV
ncbi:MAG TPA: hypothetical protein VGB55_10395 [Tepidisphaeraceae bacterium]|jgi:hypothetical protein